METSLAETIRTFEESLINNIKALKQTIIYKEQTEIHLAEIIASIAVYVAEIAATQNLLKLFKESK